MTWPLLILTVSTALAAPPPSPDAPTAAATAPAEDDPSAPVATVLQIDGRSLVLGLSGPCPWASGDSVALFVEEARADPRSGQLVPGQRYAGDAQVAWVGGGAAPLLELVTHPSAGLKTGDQLHLDHAREQSPVAAWQPPPPPPPAPPPETAVSTQAAVPPSEPAPSPSPWRNLGLLGLDRDSDGSPLGSVHQDRRIAAGQALLLSGGWSGDGAGSGLGTGALTWRLRPTRGPARVEVALVGVRGQRWVQADGDAGTLLSEDDSREPAVGYWLWSRVDSPGIGLAVFGGVGGGVEAQGLSLGGQLGLRTGHPDGSHLSADFQRWGRMGQRWTLLGQLALTPAVSTGMRVRRGDLPGHDGDFAQDRADGAVLLGLDPTPRLGLRVALGLGGYDLLIADAGLVADGAVELRW